MADSLHVVEKLTVSNELAKSVLWRRLLASWIAEVGDVLGVLEHELGLV